MHPLPRAPDSSALPLRWLTAVIANVQDAIVVLDSSGRVVFESAAATEMLGHSATASGAIGLDRIHPEEREVVIRSFERTIAVPGAVARATYRFERADGDWRHLEAIAKNLLDDPEFSGVLITLRDVTDRIRALESAERAGRARDEFLSRMSHELRTPLHAILGWAQLMEAREVPEIREAVEQISAAGRHLLRLVDETLDLAAVREGRISLDLQHLELGALVAEAIDLIRPLARRRHIRIQISPPSPAGARVHADAVRLRQVLLNLLSNAVKFSRQGGRVVIAWCPDGADAIRISVRDEGSGLDPDRLNRLFERFERLGSESSGIEGSGLGLAISRRLVQLMNGTIGALSRPGEGAEFWVRLACGSAHDRSDHPLPGGEVPSAPWTG